MTYLFVAYTVRTIASVAHLTDHHELSRMDSMQKSMSYIGRMCPDNVRLLHCSTVEANTPLPFSWGCKND